MIIRKQKFGPSSKTRFIAFVATSADGRISLTNKTLPDWTSQEDWRFFQTSLAQVEAVIVGRNTYQAAVAPLRKRHTFVLTSQLKKTQRRGTVIFVNPNQVDLAALLQPYKTVAVLGGGLVYGAMLERHMLDEIYITIEPLIFGRGKEMFIGSTRTTRLQLLSVRRLNRSGTLLLHYRIKR